LPVDALGDFLGEYMAGRHNHCVLGIHNRAKKAEILGDWGLATGQHGGAIYRPGATSTRASSATARRNFG